MRDEDMVVWRVEKEGNNELMSVREDGGRMSGLR